MSFCFHDFSVHHLTDSFAFLSTVPPAPFGVPAVPFQPQQQVAAPQNAEAQADANEGVEEVEFVIIPGDA